MNDRPGIESKFPVGLHIPIFPSQLPLDFTLPAPGQYRLVQGEREIEIDTSPGSLRSDHQALFRRRQQALVRLAHQSRAVLLEADTEQEPESVLRNAVADKLA